MIDILGFILAKLLALISLGIIATLPVMAALGFLSWLDELSDAIAWRVAVWSVAGTTLLISYVVWLAWIWPFDVPRTEKYRHIPGNLWNVVMDTRKQHDERWAGPPVITRTEDGQEVRRFILVTWNPPKHFYVTLKDVETGQVYPSTYVSKHCSTGQLRQGDEYNLKVRYFRRSDNPERRLMEFANLYNELC